MEEFNVCRGTGGLSPCPTFGPVFANSVAPRNVLPVDEFRVLHRQSAWLRLTAAEAVKWNDAQLHGADGDHNTRQTQRCAVPQRPAGGARRSTHDSLADTLLHPAYSLTERCRVGGRERERRRESTPRAMLEEHGSQGSTLSVVTMAVATPACLQVCGCHTDRQAAAPAATATLPSTQHRSGCCTRKSQEPRDAWKQTSQRERELGEWRY
ncbi:hypothetical protein C0Q70_17172 [Pomacea canaliculata]|uniref:Uncharacterized protein n=1 Tax=Pomacea canaliculata TaxID=400727 RepID=A0A2T7NRU7_POMCA|nr:hypothetical protein C0Q70_17172 [Pomacea canaliculata]